MYSKTYETLLKEMKGDIFKQPKQKTYMFISWKTYYC